MISYIKGRILCINSRKATLLVNDSIGYDIYMLASELKMLLPHQEIAFFCYHHITERSHELYGFLDKDKRDFFELLVEEVSGIGPKSALKLMGKTDPVSFIQAAASGSAIQLEAHGVSKKIAEKIIIGLQGKLEKQEGMAPALTQNQHEIIAALLQLGYKKYEIEQALGRIELQGKTVEEIIKQALRVL